MSAAACYQDDESPRPLLLPQDPTGQRFIQYFHHGWSFIQAPMPERGERPDWRTENRYPLQPRNLWSQYCDDETLLGLSFYKETNYMLLDIDRKSANHPENDRERYDGIQETMESIGLCRPVPILSSDSDGIHQYYFLPQTVHSFTLAATAKHTLQKAGYTVRDGQLELFPNPKPYNPSKPTSFKAHRLPLQKRSFLLDWDLQPIDNNVETLLDWADSSASGQDLETLLEAMQQTWHRIQKEYYRSGKRDVVEWCFHLQEQIGQGFTSFGQTNTLLRVCACYAIVFLKLGGTDLYDYVLETITTAPGYRQYCRHQHEIEIRVKDVVRSAERYYYPYPGNPLRDKTYKEHFDGAEEKSKVVAFTHPSQKRHEETLERITAVVAMLKGAGEFPATVYQRTRAIIAKSKEAYGVGGSQTTLHKPEYLPLWHPAHENTQPEERVNAYSTVEKYPILPDPWDLVEESVNLLPPKHSSDLHVPPLYEGFLLAPAGAVSEESAASSGDDQPQAGIIPLGEDIQNLPEERVFNFLTILFLTTALASTTQTIPSDPTTDSTQLNQSVTTDKYFLYPSSPAAQREKSGIDDKRTLSVPETQKDAFVDHPQDRHLPCDSAIDISAAINGAYTPVVSTPVSVPGSIPPDVSPSAPDSIPPSVLSLEPDGCGTPNTPVFSVGDSPPVVSLGVPPLAVEGAVDSPQLPKETFTPEQYREAIHFKLQALSQAKHWVRVFCTTEGIRLLPAQREELEQFVKHHLMQRSPSEVLQQEAQMWFAAHPGIKAQVEALGVSWEYIKNLQ
jgi:hypothetical protein